MLESVEEGLTTVPPRVVSGAVESTRPSGAKSTRGVRTSSTGGSAVALKTRSLPVLAEGAELGRFTEESACKTVFELVPILDLLDAGFFLLEVLAVVDELIVDDVEAYLMMRINDGNASVGRMEELEEQDSDAIDNRTM